MITIIDRYVGRYVLLSALLVLGVLAAMFVLVVLVDALGDYGRGNFHLYELVRYVVLSQPRRLYEIFPVAALVGTVLGLSMLSRTAELTALRAAGVSIARIVAAVFKTGAVLVVAAVLLGEFVVPVAETEAQIGRARALATGVRTAGAGLWLRDDSSFLNIGEVLPDRQLLRVSLYDFEERPCGEGCTDRRLRAYLSAERAYLQEGYWRLENVRVSRFEQDRVIGEAFIEQRRPTSLTAEVIDAFAVRPEGLSMLNLWRYIRHLDSHAQDTGRYRLAYWQKVFLPLAVAVMVLLATPFALRPVRGGGMSHQLFLGVMLGLAFILASRSLGYFGLLYGLPPMAGSLLPVLLFLGLALYLLRRSA